MPPLVWYKVALTNIWGLERAIGAMLLFILGVFIHHFVEVHPK
jgi:hypothetical protein